MSQLKQQWINDKVQEKEREKEGERVIETKAIFEGRGCWFEI